MLHVSHHDGSCHHSAHSDFLKNDDCAIRFDPRTGLRPGCPRALRCGFLYFGLDARLSVLPVVVGGGESLIYRCFNVPHYRARFYNRHLGRIEPDVGYSHSVTRA